MTESIKYGRGYPVEDPAVTAFREYLKIRTDHPSPDYRAAVTFLKQQCGCVGLPTVEHGTREKPVLVATWMGTNAALPSIMLNSHMDVVPAFEDKWTRSPFGGEKAEDGKIYGRGAQDIKCQGIQYLAAVDRLKSLGFKPPRTVHITFVPDEEIGGIEGMASYVKTPQFQSLNVGFAIDEGCSSPKNAFLLFYDERCKWVPEIVCSGSTGHGSLSISNTAGEKATVIMSEFYAKRAAEQKKLVGKPVPELEIAHTTTLNLTIINGGVQNNVLPEKITLTFDIRVSVNEDPEDLHRWIQETIGKAGEGVSMKFLLRDPKVPPTKIDSSNPFWEAFKSQIDESKIHLLPIPSPGTTDARYLRALGIPTFGFCAIRNTPLLLHCNDEYIDENVFLEGIDIFTKVIQSVSAVP